MAAATLAAAAVLGACAPMPPGPTLPAEYVGTRSVSVQLSGGATYTRSGPVTGGRLTATYGGAVPARLAGDVQFAGAAGGTATATFDLTFDAGTYDGTVVVSDPGAGVSTTVTHTDVAVTFDDDADASATATDGATTLAWSVSTARADGLVPPLDRLTAQEATFCREAQRELVRLDATTLPDGQVTQVANRSRSTFVTAKVVPSPLAVQEWTQPDMATTAGGEPVAIAHRISCKMASADRLASLGLPGSPDLECRTQNTRALAAARAEMTQAERDAFGTTGRQVVLTADRLGVAGPDWLSWVDDEHITAGGLELTAGALRVDLNDPAFAGLPDNVRGVHYCTTWTPAWAYWWMTSGAFQP